MDRYDNVIIGNSAAGVGAVEGLRSQGGGVMHTCLISSEAGPAYSRPFIGHLIEGRRSMENLVYRRREFYDDDHLAHLAGVSATSLDLEERTVSTECGNSIGFRNLLIATGGKAIIPPIPGLRQNSTTFMSLSDVAGIDARIEGGEVESAVVLGGGLIGAAAVSALAPRGVKTTVVELAPRILSSVLDPDGSTIVQDLFDGAGITTVTGHTLAEVRGTPERPVCLVDNGQVIEADLLVAAIGVRPQVELAENTEIRIDRGIIVDRHMRTNVEGVYSAGDCAQVYDSLRRRSSVLALWPTAYAGGRVAGANMAGGSEVLEWSTTMNSMSFFGTPVLSAGFVEALQEEGWSEIRELGNGGYRKLVIRDGVMKGFVLIGDVERAGIYLQLMRSGLELRRLKANPLSEGFGIVHLPTRVRQRLSREALGVA